MSTIRKLVTIVILFAFLLVLFTTVSANAPMDTNETTNTPNINPYEYGTAPEHLYVFLYRGYEPYLSVEIDTSTCVEGRLYVFDAERNTVTEISCQQVSFYTCTKDALFFVTSAQEIYKADYTGRNVEFLYQSEMGPIDDFDNYLDILYFIEDGERVVFFDYNTKVTQTVWICSDLAWSFLLSPTELVAATIDEEHYLLNITTGIVSSIGSMTANRLIAEAVTNASEARDSGISLMAYFSPSGITQENDISLPLAEYPVTYGNTPDFQNGTYTDPVSWFHEDSTQEGCDGGNNCKLYTETWECEGFARYAHDRYLHNVASNGTGYDAWFAIYPSNSRRELDSITSITDFFSDLNTGDYVRYGNYGDDTPANGMHSIVFVNMDENGIWAYECNQKYYDDLPDGRKDDHDPDDYGCGIHLQYYTFQNIKNRYNYVLYYISHNYVETPTYSNTTYHNVGCDHCVGYLRQKHDNVQADYVNASRHRIEFACCDAGNIRTLAHNDVHKILINRTSHRTEYRCCNYNSASTAHTGDVIYTSISSSKHSVGFSCCEGSVTEVHMYSNIGNDQQECILCGYIYSNLLDTDDEEIA